MKKLEVGQSFEVVKVVNSNFSVEVFKVGGWTIKFNEWASLLNGSATDNVGAEIVFGQKCFCLPVYGEKPVGRLIIKSVK